MGINPLGFVVELSPIVFMDTVSLCVYPVRRNTMKLDPLRSMKNIGLNSLRIKESKIPINPIKLVKVRVLKSS